MKTPSWEPSPGALVAWLNANRQARPVDLWTIVLLGGTVLRYSGGDVPITVDGTTWALGPGIQRGTRTQTIGTSVDTLSLTVLADASVLVGAVPILQALAKGLLTGATVTLERAFLDATATCQGTVPDFYGRVGACKVGRSSATLEVRSHSELLDVMIPTELYQPGCRNTVFDAACGLAAAAHTVAGVTAAAGDATRRTITSTSAAVVAKATAWADLGVLTFSSGLNTGVRRTVRSHVLATGTATVAAVFPFPLAIGAGDAFSLRAGCDKTKALCTTKFANLVHFRGEPFVPAPETIT